MRLTGARAALSADSAPHLDIRICHGRLSYTGLRSRSASEFDLSGYLLLPGLINAHDHLEFNLFPRLGRGPYPNAKAWASDIFRPRDSPIREHLAVPKHARLAWGGIKNLLSGATTVAHHNPYDPSAFGRQFPVRVVRRYGWAHSLDFSPDMTERFRRTPKSWPFMLHAAEGADEKARAETGQLERLGILSERTVLVHAVGVDSAGLERLLQRQSSIVWCPSSNLFTCGRTLDRTALASGLTIMLGSDSALTAEGDLIDEILLARSASGVTRQQVYRMVTANAARALRLEAGLGALQEGAPADLLAVADGGQTPAEALADLPPELVMIGGRIKLISVRLARRFRRIDWGSLHEITVEGRGEWLTDFDVRSLHQHTASALGQDYRLAGKRVRV